MSGTMTEPKNKRDRGVNEAEVSSTYEPPRITHREPLEAVATACTAATAKGDVGTCPMGPINS